MIDLDLDLDFKDDYSSISVDQIESIDESECKKIRKKAKLLAKKRSGLRDSVKQCLIDAQAREKENAEIERLWLIHEEKIKTQAAESPPGASISARLDFALRMAT